MSKKLLIIVAALVVVGGGTLAYYIKNGSPLERGTNESQQSQSTYSLNLMSSKSYMAAKPVMLHYSIQDQEGNTLKDFDTVHEKKMHLIVVRKDRTNFQHVHPTFDENTGMFMIEPFTFPTDGEYRVFADFTPSNAQKDEMGMKLPVTPYQDVQVGDLNKYTPQPITADKWTSSSDGFDTAIFFAPGDDGALNKKFNTGQNTVAIEVNKNGQPFKNLQNYLGALGHMVVLGPNLEFIHAHPTDADINNQAGLITFSVDFPSSGQFRLFLQTQANEQVTTNDLTLSVGGSEMNMPSMDHSGH